MRDIKRALLILGFMSVYLILNGQSISIDRQVTMLALGDSYTIGESVDMPERWPNQFIDELRKLDVSADYPDYIAATGWTTRRLIQGVKFQLDQDKDYNLVSILIGVNNQYQGIDIESYEPDLRTIIDLALDIVNQDASRVFILSIPDYAFTPFGGEDEEISQEIDDYNNIKRNIASEYGVVYIDITPISRNGLNNPSLVARDGLHPSGLQYQLWAQSIVPRLTLDLSLSENERRARSTETVRIYPNPARSTLYIENDYSIDQIRIYNVMGNLVFDLKLNDLNALIDLSHFVPGTYSLWIDPSDNQANACQSMLIVQ